MLITDSNSTGNSLSLLTKMPLYFLCLVFALFVLNGCDAEQELPQSDTTADTETAAETPAETPAEFRGSELTVGTFNIKWLGDGEKDRTPRTEAEYKLIAETIRDTEADVLALQEIENGGAIERIQAHLPGFDYVISKRGGGQKVAFLYRETLDVKKLADFDELAISSGLRPGLVIECDNGEFDCILMAVHFKATSSYDNTEEKRERSYRIRREQSALVNSWFEAILAEGREDDVIVLGDFNDNPIDDATPTLTALQDNPAFDFLTGHLESCKNSKWTSIDHIAVSQGVQAYVDEASIGMFSLYHRYKREVAERISDHCPVLVRLQIDTQDKL